VVDKVLVVLPAFNEEKSLGKVIDEIRTYCPTYDILVVDNNSTNGTAKVAQEKGVQFLFVKEQGKGCAINEAFLGAAHWEYSCVVMMDADFTYPAAYIPYLVGRLGGEYDVVLGWRKYKARGSMTTTNKIGNYLLTKLANVLYGTNIHDVCSGMWAFCNEWAYSLGGSTESKGFTLEAEMFSKLRKRNLRIGEVAIDYRAREDKPKLRVWDGFKIGYYLVRERFRR